MSSSKKTKKPAAAPVKKAASTPHSKSRAAAKRPAAKPKPSGRPAALETKVKSKAPAASATGRAVAPVSAAAHHPEGRTAAAATKKPARRGGGGGRRDGKTYTPGELLLPGGSQTADEALYLFRGCVAAEHAVGHEGLHEVLAKRGLTESEPVAEDIKRLLAAATQRFASGVIDPLLPSRAQARRTFSGVLERVRGRRREIGAFLRGLDVGRTEVSHLDSHAETSLQNLMEWTARIEKMVEEGQEPEQADYNQLHRGIDQLDNTTEALIVDLELTLKRLRDRVS
jgi:hypothetical protein